MDSKFVGVPSEHKVFYWLISGVKKLTKILQQIIMACFSNLIYMIWRTRNEAIWQLRVRRIDSLMRALKHDVKIRILSIPFKKPSKSRVWLEHIFTWFVSLWFFQFVCEFPCWLVIFVSSRAACELQVAKFDDFWFWVSWLLVTI